MATKKTPNKGAAKAAPVVEYRWDTDDHFDEATRKEMKKLLADRKRICQVTSAAVSKAKRKINAWKSMSDQEIVSEFGLMKELSDRISPPRVLYKSQDDHIWAVRALNAVGWGDSDDDDEIELVESSISVKAELSLQMARVGRYLEQKQLLANATKLNGAKGGATAAAHWEKVSKKAVTIATDKGFADGNYSADFVAGEIEDDVRAFAKLNGRDFPGQSARRKIAEYLRDAGIKKIRTP